jgi:hypothetical protein
VSGPGQAVRKERSFSLDRLLGSDRFVLAALLLLAAGLRFVALPERGQWDADQGRDLLVLRSLVVDGVMPLVGPVTSVGGLHHGAAYFYLLAPVAALGGLDPGVIVMLFAVAGVATVGLVWWLARSVGGPMAGLVAGLLVAVSPTAIAASVTIWNPNLVAPAAALALATAWRAWTSRRPRWWVLAVAATGLTVQLHVVAAVLAVPVVGLLIADVRRSTPSQRRLLAGAAIGGAAMTGLLFLPLLANELTTGFSETRAALELLREQRGGGLLDLPGRLLITIVRLASWPVVGLVVDAPALASLVTALVTGIAAWRWIASRGPEQTGTRWLAGAAAWSAVALTFVAPDLAIVVRGLPNDQYHAFTDPIVAVLLALGVAGLTTGRPDPGPRPVLAAAGGTVAAGLVMALVAVELIRIPPLRDPDGGWPAARSAAERVVRAAGDRSLLVVGLPPFKPTDGFVFPLGLLGGQTVDAAAGADALVVVCDRLYEAVLAAACGGAAERIVEAEQPRFPSLVDRFDLSGRTSISVYFPAASR